jgi:serine/threonine-protein kinase
MRNDEIHPGDLIAGKYRVRTILGRSHGLLVEAFHTEFDQRVIIKVLLAGNGDEREIERFRREARILSKLESEHVARIIDVGTETDGSFYLVRQYLEGVDLGSYLRDTGPLALEDAVLTILMAAEALAETHGHGIIVRELSPDHIFLTSRAGGSPLVKITDFGTAKLMRDAAAPSAGGELTATAMFGLSPYSSPELIRKARNVDARTDVWSLGAIFYELLTGRPPFQGETAALMLGITKDEPPPVTQFRHDLPAEIDQIIGWALAKDLDARFKNVNAFAHALKPYASNEAQVLIERIAQIADASKSKKRGGSVPPPAPSFRGSRPAPPPSYRSMQQPPGDDSVTNIIDAPDSRPASIPAPPPPPRARSVPPSPAIPQSVAPPPPPAARAWNSVPPSAATTVITTPAAAAPPRSNERTIMVAALAVLAIVLPVMLVVMLLRKPVVAEGQTVVVATALPVVTATATAAPIATAAAATVDVPSATVAVPVPVQPTATAQPVAAADPPTKKQPAKTNAAPPPAPPPPPTNDAATGGANGTLLAVAVGGSCNFAVNGATKGSGSTLRVALKPGTYAISCKPESGAAKSKSVQIKSGETTMASFKL